MKKESFSDKNLKAIGPYSAVIKAGNLIFVSGQIPIDPHTGALAEGIEKQTEQVLENIKRQLVSAGMEMDQVVQCTIYTTQLENFTKINEIYSHYFSEPYPTRATVGVNQLPKGSLIEISAIAMN